MLLAPFLFVLAMLSRFPICSPGGLAEAVQLLPVRDPFACWSFKCLAYPSGILFPVSLQVGRFLSGTIGRASSFFRSSPVGIPSPASPFSVYA